jgi:translation elongation factor EF-Ts
MDISATRVKELREATGAGVLECRKALEQWNGDLEKATAYLREKGFVDENSQGHILLTVAGRKIYTNLRDSLPSLL